MKRPRFTVRRLMVVVAASGLLLGFVVWGEARRARFNRIVLEQERAWRELTSMCSDGEPLPGPGVTSAFETKVLFLQSMNKKYRHAARYPWLPVEPDPPEPK